MSPRPSCRKLVENFGAELNDHQCVLGQQVDISVRQIMSSNWNVVELASCAAAGHRHFKVLPQENTAIGRSLQKLVEPWAFSRVRLGLWIKAVTQRHF